MYGLGLRVLYDVYEHLARHAVEYYAYRVVGGIVLERAARRDVPLYPARYQKLVGERLESRSDADLEKYAEDNHVSLDELIDAFGRETAEETVLEQKAIDFVVDNAVVKYVSADELSDTSEGEVSDDNLAESEAEADGISEESSQAETEE